MQLVLTEDQELISKTATDFVTGRSPVSRMRALRDSADRVGFSRELWKEMAELGWVGIPFPESVGGAGMGLADLIVVVEALGRNLAPEPFLSCVGLAGSAISLVGNAAQHAEWLTPLVQGERLIAFAHSEAGGRYDVRRVQTRAVPDAKGFRLSGTKVQVLDGHVADAFVVVARTSGGEADEAGIGLFIVPASATGVSVQRQTRVDSRNAAIVQLSDVAVPPERVLGRAGGEAAALDRIIDRATIVLCAEMLGGMSQAFDLTLAYLKERVQFETVIGSFQGLKHRAARVFMEIELSRSCVMAAARALDEGSVEVSKLVSLAKARCSDAYVLAANEGVQMFGGVGMTDEYDIGLYMKRARAAELSFGDAAHHRDRWAVLSGY